jgi:SAM-dependent methyltransferase
LVTNTRTPIRLPPETLYRRVINILKRNRLALSAAKALNPGRRVEIAALMRRLVPTPGDRIIDIGCGDGYWTNYFGRHATSVVGIDPYLHDLTKAARYGRPGSRFCLATSEALPFPEGAFTKAVSVCVFEHLYDDQRALREIHRVLAPEGICAATVDSLDSPHVSDSHRQWHMKVAYCRQLYTAESIKELYRQAGFRNVVAHYIMGSPVAVAWEILTERVGAASLLAGPLAFPIIRLLERQPRDTGYKLLVCGTK